MFTIERIASLDLPELQPYRTMRRQMAHRERGIFVAEGEKVVRRLLASKFGVVSALMPEKWVDELTPLFEKRPETVRVFVANKALLETLTGFSMYQGLLAVGKIPEPRLLEPILESASQPFLVVAVDSLSNAENLGALVRNCVAFGTQALIVGETSSSPFLRRAVRSSMGTVFELPIIETSNLLESLSSLKERGVRCIAAALPTFNESTVGGIGIATASSHNSSTVCEIPWPSLPKTMQQFFVKSASDNVRPSTCGCAAMQRTPRSFKLDKDSNKLDVSIIGNSNTVPMELRTARRRKGLLEVSPTINAWVPKATQFLTSAPRFSAFDSESTATTKNGCDADSRIRSSGLGSGIFPTASKP